MLNPPTQNLVNGGKCGGQTVGFHVLHFFFFFFPMFYMVKFVLVSSFVGAIILKSVQLPFKRLAQMLANKMVISQWISKIVELGSFAPF